MSYYQADIFSLLNLLHTAKRPYLQAIFRFLDLFLTKKSTSTKAIRYRDGESFFPFSQDTASGIENSPTIMLSAEYGNSFAG